MSTERQSALPRLRRIALAALAGGLSVVVLFAGEPAAAAAKTRIPGNGTYRVGVDVKSGLYRSTANDSCYWARLKNASGSLSAIIANEFASGQMLVSVRKTDRYIETSGCRTFTRVSAATQKSTSKKVTIPGSGTYLVGPDFKPGTYMSKANDGCYWERGRTADGTLASIIANDNVDGQAIVAIKKTDKVFKSSRCNTWKRIG